MNRVLKFSAIATALCLVGITLFLAFFDWNVLRDWVAHAAEKRIGRSVAIETLDVRVGFRPTARVSGVRISNPEWAALPNLLEAERVAVTLSLWSLLRGGVAIHDLEIVKPRIALEQRGSERTWAFGSEGEGAAPVIHRLTVIDGLVNFRDQASKTNVDVNVATTGENGENISVSAKGTFRGEAVTGEASGPALLLLTDPSQPYPLKANAAIGATRARIAGTITGLAAFEALDLEVELAGQNLADMESMVDANIPETPPYKVAGHIVRNGGEWRFDPLRGMIGDTDVSGSFSYAPGRVRPMLRANLVSNNLDFDDLGPLIGTPPKTGPGETASPKQRAEAQKRAQSAQVLPDKPFQTGRWDRMDADVRLVGKRVVRAPTLPIDTINAHLRLENAVLRLDPLEFDTAGGHVVATIELDGQSGTLHSKADVQFRNLRLADLFPTVAAMQKAKGLAHGHARLRGEGNSVARMLATADGRIALAVNSGTISNLVLELIGLDAGETLRIFAAGDREIKLNCAIFDLDVHNGIGTTNVFLLDTADTLVVGTGTVDLRDERLDLTLYPRPKDMSILAARSPLHVRGQLRDPTVRPDAKTLAGRGLGAVLLGLVNPLLALIPLIETGPGRDSDCGRLVADAQNWTRDPAARDGEQATATPRKRP